MRAEQHLKARIDELESEKKRLKLAAKEAIEMHGGNLIAIRQLTEQNAWLQRENETMTKIIRARGAA